MTIAQVRYTVKAEYAAENKERINRVVSELRAMHRTDITYSIFVEDDGKTFIHMLLCANDEAGKVFSQLQSFKEFQAAHQASQPEVPPTATSLMLVGSTDDLLS